MDPKPNGKLSDEELTDILGPRRARECRAQDQQCKAVYDDMEERTVRMSELRDMVRAAHPDIDFDAEEFGDG